MCLFELFAEITLGKIIHGNVDESSACWLVAVMMMVVRVANAAPLFDDHNACQKVSIIRIVGFTFAKIEYRLHITQRVRTHTLTLAQQIMHVWDFRIRLVHFFFRSLVVLCVCINVSINDLRVPILFRFSRTMTMVREYVLRVVSHSYLSWNLFISAGLLQLLARLFFFASSLHSFLKYFPIGVDVFFLSSFTSVFIVIHCFGHRNRHAMECILSNWLKLSKRKKTNREGDEHFANPHLVSTSKCKIYIYIWKCENIRSKSSPLLNG